MVTPAAKRQAVTHACEGHELSDVAPARSWGSIARWSAIAAGAPMTWASAAAFENSPQSAVASATGACTSC